MRAVAILIWPLIAGCGGESSVEKMCDKVLSEGCDREIKCGRGNDHFSCLENERAQWSCWPDTTTAEFDACLLDIQEEECVVSKPTSCLAILCSSYVGCVEDTTNTIED